MTPKNSEVIFGKIKTIEFHANLYVQISFEIDLSSFKFAPKRHAHYFSLGIIINEGILP